MLEDTKDLLEKIKKQSDKRSSVIWSGTSITGYIWDIIRNLIVIGVVLTIYSVVYESESVIIVSILILTYLSVISIGAQISQSVAKGNLLLYSQTNKILKKTGEEISGEDSDDFENANFLLEKFQYKFILNSVFNFVIFLIVLVNLLGAL